MKTPVLYEDNHLLFVEKPVNVLVQEDRSKDEDLLTRLKKEIKKRDQKPGNVYLGLVHRLDRPVGGVMVFAKTSKAASRLSNQLRQQTMQRKYLAVVHGTIKQRQGTWTHYLVKDRRKNQVSVVLATHPEAKKAVLSYEVLKATKKMSLVAVELHTGRSHQIRIQFAASGHPLVGDQKYGQSQNQVGQQIALWAHTLEIEHPTKKERLLIQSNPPETYPWTLW